MRLIRRIDFTINGTRTKKESVLGSGEIWGVEEGKGVFVVAGSVTGGCPGGDAAWSVEGMVIVSVSLTTFSALVRCSYSFF